LDFEDEDELEILSDDSDGTKINKKSMMQTKNSVFSNA